MLLRLCAGGMITLSEMRAMFHIISHVCEAHTWIQIDYLYIIWCIADLPWGAQLMGEVHPLEMYGYYLLDYLYLTLLLSGFSSLLLPDSNGVRLDEGIIIFKYYVFYPSQTYTLRNKCSVIVIVIAHSDHKIILFLPIKMTLFSYSKFYF